MQQFKRALCGLALSLAFGATSNMSAAADQTNTIRIGVITSLTGVAAQSGEQMKAGIDTYLRLDADTWFTKTFTALGGTVTSSVRVPLTTVDYSAYLQRIKDEKPDAIHVFLPNGQPMVSFIKAYKEKGLDKAGIRFLGGEGWADEDVLSM